MSINFCVKNNEYVSEKAAKLKNLLTTKHNVDDASTEDVSFQMLDILCSIANLCVRPGNNGIDRE